MSYLQISEDRLHHIIGVARKMKEMVQSEPDKYSITPEEAFTLGLLHDIGYEFVENQLEHNHKGGEILKNQGYKYWKEVYYHGIDQDEYTSQELWLLNYVDTTIGPKGEPLTLNGRVENIRDRYGEDSIQLKGATALISKLKEQGWE